MSAKRLTEENPIWLEEELWYTAEYPDAEEATMFRPDMTLDEALQNREDCLKYLKGLGKKASPNCVEAVWWSVKALEKMKKTYPVNGRWILKKIDNFRKFEISCSVCGWTGINNYDSYDDPSDFNYCPNCGAKMDKEET